MECSDVEFLLPDAFRKRLDKYLSGIILVTTIDRRMTFSVAFYSYDLYFFK